MSGYLYMIKALKRAFKPNVLILRCHNFVKDKKPARLHDEPGNCAGIQGRNLIPRWVTNILAGSDNAMKTGGQGKGFP